MTRETAVGRTQCQADRCGTRRGETIDLTLLATTILLCTLTGCPRPLRVARPYPVPAAATLAEALSLRQRQVSSMNARVRATSWLGGDRVRATVLMLVDRPGRLRFEAEVSLQGTVAVLATDGRRFGFLDTMKNELRRGPACAANVASLIRIPLAPADVAAILLGDVRLPTGVDAAADGLVDWDPSLGADVLAVRRYDGWLRVLFQGAGDAATAAPGIGDAGRRNLRIVGAIATGSDGRSRWRVGFEDFADARATARAGPGEASAAAVPLPQTIRFAEGDTPFEEGVEMKVKERLVNDPIADSAFDLPPPPGTRTLEIGCPTSASAGP